MNEFDREHLAAWVDDHLEAYVDGELPLEERRRVEAFVEADDEAARRLDLARRVQALLAASEPPACPPEVTRTVLATADRPPLRRVRSSFGAVLRPSLAAAALVAVVVASALVGPRPAPTPETADVSAAEVEQALHDARWALAYVSDVGRRTGRSIRHEVIEERVAEPLQRAVGAALDAGLGAHAGEEPSS